MIFFDEEKMIINDKGCDFCRDCFEYMEWLGKNRKIDDMVGEEFLVNLMDIISDVVNNQYHLYRVIELHEDNKHHFDQAYYKEAYDILISEATHYGVSKRLHRRVRINKEKWMGKREE